VTVSVARRYFFTAEHWVPWLPEPWNQPHVHSYTVEVVASGDLDSGGLVVDTDLIDDLWRVALQPDENHTLNAQYSDTTVEGLSRMWLAEFRDRLQQVVSVTVWEDDNRWGRAEA
jgi:6-pyruvoyl-tetrahydropterin synthase